MASENICLKRSSKPRRSCDSISILVVDDDTTCLAVVAALLKKFKYSVVTAKHPNDALCALRIKGGAFDLVVSDVNMPDMNGFQLREAITHEFNLPVILMSVDSKEVVLSKANKSGAALFISKPVSPNDLKDLWQFAAIKKKANSNENSKRRPHNKERFECGDANTKKPKVIWTNALHYRFLEAIRSIGLESKENVASHLQKYRMFLKRVSDASCKLEDDEAMIRTTSYASNYSLYRLTKPQFRFENFPDSYQTHPTSYISLGSNSINRNSEVTSALPSTTHLVHQQSGNSVNFAIDELLNNIDQTCYAEHLNEPLLLPPLPWSNLSLVQDQQFNGGIVDDSPFCSVYELPASNVQQPFNLNPTHLHSSIPSYQLINFQQQHGCEYTESSSLLYDGIGMNSSSYDLAGYQVQGTIDSVVFGTTSSQFHKAIDSTNQACYSVTSSSSITAPDIMLTTDFCSMQCDYNDAALESLLAFGLFGEDQIQTLEGL
ncbi:two-component response regulator ARR10-like [Salvia splendens]|uniref:two-component response regulator ARR10-like n=1 Tax=Salvia splendens TaxID=180675 RepID=UPI001C262E6D|nr:two-component response regulator ARR10-like [Salvia splendens]